MLCGAAQPNARAKRRAGTTPAQHYNVSRRVRFSPPSGTARTVVRFVIGRLTTLCRVVIVEDKSLSLPNAGISRARSASAACRSWGASRRRSSQASISHFDRHHLSGSNRRGCCAAGHHSTRWSARRRSDGGIVRSRARAVLRLMTNSSFVGCSIGRSAGFAPLRILST